MAAAPGSGRYQGMLTEQDSIFPPVSSVLTARRWKQGVAVVDRGAQLTFSLEGSPSCVFVSSDRSGSTFSLPINQTCRLSSPGDSRSYNVATGSGTLVGDRMSFELTGAINGQSSGGNYIGKFNLSWSGTRSR